ncbi:hypothetical protein ADH72_01440 [Akkermansia muciniphila]|nr:hypothetical protein A4V05_05720 [Akkermansia muciniphila]ASB34457.1 hypothetical protein ADH72_01440 [Akkermansia muciniphila]PNC81574.1 hypothetical protein CXT92_08125 [Akkermansia muciniphila]PNC92074.1 hypothetical protein CXT91_04165 [Akkermansia muciniphila]PND15626.1 hypothetical protein CXT96_01355 [Akkermansia muciniphila]
MKRKYCTVFFYIHYILYYLFCFLEKILLSCVIFSVFRMLLFCLAKGGRLGVLALPRKWAFHEKPW